MDTHFRNLLLFVPDILSRTILDLGCGRGKFLVDMTRRGAHVVGYDNNIEYVKTAQKNLEKEGLRAEVIHGAGESLPFEDALFGFINMAEVIEHVENPEKVMAEAYRVLKTGGSIYVSVPNRFGLKDPHYHLYGINWVPRSIANKIIAKTGLGKSDKGEAGRQALGQMHYYTRSQFKTLAQKVGFHIKETRVEKIKKLPFSAVGLCLYALIAPWYIDTFHFIMTKEKRS